MCSDDLLMCKLDAFRKHAITIRCCYSYTFPIPIPQNNPGVEYRQLTCCFSIRRWFVYNTEVLSCQNNRLVPASTSHRKDLIDKIDNLKAGGTSEFE